MACSILVPLPDPALTPASLERQLVRERERTRTLREVGLLLDSTVPRDELLKRVLSAAARVSEAERATLYLMEPDGEHLASHAMEGGDASRIVLEVGRGIAGSAARERRSVRAPDAYEDARFSRTWDEKTGFRTRSVLASPMLTPEGKVVGVLQVLNQRGQGVFDDDDVAMLEALAAHAAVAIEGARRLESMVETNRTLTEMRGRLERSLRERDLLLETEQLLSRSDSLEEFLAGALRGVMRECRARAGAVLLYDDAGSLRVQAMRGGDTTLGAIAPHDSVAARVAVSGEAMLVVGTPQADERSVLGGPPPDALLVVPLPGESRSLGAIELRDRPEGPFGYADLDLVTLVAANLSTGVQLETARSERERATRLADVGRALSNVLHDVRSPMTVISGYAQLMPDVHDVAERARLAKAIVRQFDHIQGMIGELLAFVRGESQLLVNRVPIEPFFTETVEVLRHELGARGVSVSLAMHTGGVVRFDAAKITRMIHNLARNAADAMSERGGGTFGITVERDGNDLVMSFADNGPGIPENVRGRLFESFATGGKPGGTGLGLPIVKRVIDEHRGTLTVQSTPSGTCFVARIPIDGPAASSPPNAAMRA